MAVHVRGSAVNYKDKIFGKKCNPNNVTTRLVLKMVKIVGLPTAQIILCSKDFENADSY